MVFRNWEEEKEVCDIEGIIAPVELPHLRKTEEVAAAPPEKHRNVVVVV